MSANIPQDVRIAAAAYSLPSCEIAVSDVMAAEAGRIQAALLPLNEGRRQKILDGLGIERVRVCESSDPFGLALSAAKEALARAGVAPPDLNLIVDFSTLTGARNAHISFAQRVGAELEAETALTFGFRVGGCGGLHLAIKTAVAMMSCDERIRNALLISADSPPPGSRSLLPITIQGDAGGAVVLARGGPCGPRILATDVLTLSHLYDVISIGPGELGNMLIRVDSTRVEDEVMPIYYLNFYRLVHRVLQECSMKLADVDHFVYSNISRTDQDGFIRAFSIPEAKIHTSNVLNLGHTFANDLIINYCDLMKRNQIAAGQALLFASAGIGFTWGVTLARA